MVEEEEEAYWPMLMKMLVECPFQKTCWNNVDDND
jgi:hypothetical protein